LLKLLSNTEEGYFEDGGSNYFQLIRTQKTCSEHQYDSGNCCFYNNKYDDTTNTTSNEKTFKL
jgi:hypothetical protein